jgi:hypothetical protein
MKKENEKHEEKSREERTKQNKTPEDMSKHDKINFLEKDRYQPYPELVSKKRGPWSVVDTIDTPGLPTTGLTDMRRRVIYVPLASDGRPVSSHELAHVKWSPTRVDWKELKVAPPYVMAVEDARINLGLARRGMDLVFAAQLRREILSIARRDLGREDIVTFTLRTIASFGTNVERILRRRIARDDQPIFATIRELVAGAHERLRRARMACGGEVATFEQGVEVARWLASEFKKLGFPEPGHGGAVAACFGHLESASAGRGAAAGNVLRQLRANCVPPGRMTIATPPLLERCVTPAAARARRRRAVAEGTELRYFHRFFIDQQVFARRINKSAVSGGTVLIDTSGSMRITPDGVDRIIDAAPAAQIAIYSGCADSGELRIVVRNGRRASRAHLESHGTGNVIDLPALRWLAKQTGPRVWISDGHVTGCGDMGTPEMKAACERVCVAARIVRVADAGQAAKALSTASF